MREWFKRFQSPNTAINFQLKGQTYKKSDFEYLASGSEKHVWKIKDTDQCFFLPNKVKGVWDDRIGAEKAILDFITELGLKTQQFEMIPMVAQEEGKPDATINVLVTKQLQSLCEEESLVIYNPKGLRDRVVGNPPNLRVLREQLRDPIFARKMLRQIVSEYAIAFTFQLPISIIQYTDDSQHFLLELPVNGSSEPPLIRYIFWDVVSDFSGSGWPLVPNLGLLKSGGESSYSSSPIRGLGHLANGVAVAITEMSNNDPNSDTTQTSTFEYCRLLEQDLTAALNDDDFLKQALAQAREKGLIYFNKNLDGLTSIPQDTFVPLIVMAISLENLAVVQRLLSSCPSQYLLDLSEPQMEEIRKASQGYEKSADAVGYLCAEKQRLTAENHRQLAEKLNNESAELKSRFLKEYELQWDADKASWCGIYSFFARSNVDENKSLRELVQHARGLSEQGSGKRSQEVMKRMGWLDENNEVTAEIGNYLSLG
ncbi:hypothetical protein BN59_01571 [Legionella massiliensis]|uniref:Uncharacterized protein n=1 Tax=Legionella massiliensis TaxID=1034943 RepID=A0A078KZR8_9GAMM|nr:hypothetical protein [Legionella massiliensis]CDZ77288.1 hypothetical protein BN59_01571 [Legionella massiliensis]CEE13026.1 hypothetical protein BN1094_01571 [Legionella massiliensis]